MKMSEALLRTIVAVIQDTNARYESCNPTVPQWTGTFAFLLQKRLNEKVDV